MYKTWLVPGVRQCCTCLTNALYQCMYMQTFVVLVSFAGHAYGYIGPDCILHIVGCGFLWEPYVIQSPTLHWTKSGEIEIIQKSRSQRETVLSRIRIVHTCFTHSYLLKEKTSWMTTLPRTTYCLKYPCWVYRYSRYSNGNMLQSKPKPWKPRVCNNYLRTMILIWYYDF